jgi:hypothetical protein
MSRLAPALACIDSRQATIQPVDVEAFTHFGEDPAAWALLRCDAIQA